jgi:nitronate monooxygenase
MMNVIFFHRSILFVNKITIAPLFLLDPNHMSLHGTTLSQSLELKYPLIVAPMAGGPSSVDLVVASSESGALGSIGGAYLSPQALDQFLQEVKSKTQKPICVNLFVPSQLTQVDKTKLDLAIRRTEKFRKELSIPTPPLTPPFEENFENQLEIILHHKPKVFSFVFGLLERPFIQALKKAGIYIVGTATSPSEALALEESGVDAVVAQGIEAGGHRGIFDPNAEDPQIKTLDLIQQIKAQSRIPIIAAGGIMTAQDIQEALKAGAQAAQMGTAFLATKEAGSSSPYRQALLQNPDRQTKTTRAFSGRLARGLVNRFMIDLDAHPEAILPFPAQNKFTRDLRTSSAQQGSPDFLSLWSGSGKGDLWTGSAGELISKLFLLH